MFEKKAAAAMLLCLGLAATSGASRAGGAGSGNLTLEAKDPEKTYARAAEAAARHGAVVASYSAHKGAQEKISTVSAQFTVDKAKIAVLMSDLAALGKV